MMRVDVWKMQASWNCPADSVRLLRQLSECLRIIGGSCHAAIDFLGRVLTFRIGPGIDLLVNYGSRSKTCPAIN